MQVTSISVRYEDRLHFIEKIFTDNFKVLSPEYTSFLGTFTQGDYNDINEPYRRRWTKDVSQYAINIS